MTLLDSLKIQLKGYFSPVSGKNYVKIFDTPKVWGQPFNSNIMPSSLKREAEFQNAAMSVLEDMRYRTDIASLNPPDKPWRDVILSQIDKVMRQKIGRTERPQIRMLFAQTTSAALDGIAVIYQGTPEYVALKKDIIKLIKENGSEWECIPDIWIGRFYRIIDGLLHSAIDKIIPPTFDPKNTKMTWNHCKIIATDGNASFVGGHNLNMDLFKNYPPVHDVSVHVLGDAPLDAQLFLNGMWGTGKDLLTREYFDITEKKWVNVDEKVEQPADPFAREDVMAYVHQKQAERLANKPADPEYHLADRILSVGKYWIGPDIRTDYLQGSNVMKEFLIKNAKKKIRMSQQDIFSAWKKDWDQHPVCQWILEALLANPELEVELVVSPLDAAAGAAGDQYSFGSGASRSFGLMKYYMTHDPKTDKLLPDPDGKRAEAIKRLQIAPLCYTDQVPENARQEGKTYKWPGVDKAAYTATLKEPTLETKPPKHGIINHPAEALAQASGLLLPKVAPAPGNHAKVTIIDDDLYVVGSDNLYPGYQSEFNYVIEGKDAVDQFIESYWTPLWKYSSQMVVNDSNYKGGPDGKHHLHLPWPFDINMMKQLENITQAEAENLYAKSVMASLNAKTEEEE